MPSCVCTAPLLQARAASALPTSSLPTTTLFPCAAHLLAAFQVAPGHTARHASRGVDERHVRVMQRRLDGHDAPGVVLGALDVPLTLQAGANTGGAGGKVRVGAQPSEVGTAVTGAAVLESHGRCSTC